MAARQPFAYCRERARSGGCRGGCRQQLTLSEGMTRPRLEPQCARCRITQRRREQSAMPERLLLRQLGSLL